MAVAREIFDCLLPAVRNLQHTPDLDALAQVLDRVERLDEPGGQESSAARAQLQDAGQQLWKAVKEMSTCLAEHPSVVARIRQLAVVIFFAVTRHKQDPRQTEEVCRAALRCAEDWLAVGEHRRCEEVAGRGLQKLHALPRTDMPPATRERLNTAEARLTLVSARACQASGRSDRAYDTLSQAAQLLWAARPTDAFEIIGGAAEGAHATKQHQLAVKWAQLGEGAPAEVDAASRARLMRVHADALHCLGQGAEAVDTVRRANRTCPDPMGAFLLGKLSAAAGDAESARAASRELLDFPGVEVPTAMNLAQVLLKAGMDEAAAEFLQALSLHFRDCPEGARVDVMMFAWLCRRADDGGARRQAYARLCELVDGHLNGDRRLQQSDLVALYHDAHRCAMRVLAGAEQSAAADEKRKEAEQWLERVVAVVPPAEGGDRMRILTCLAELSVAKGDHENAVVLAQSARTADPSAAAPCWVLFKAKLALKDATGAAAVLQQLPAESPQDHAAMGEVFLANAAEEAYERGYPELCAEAIRLTLSLHEGGGRPGQRLEAQLQLLFNCVKCLDEAAGTDRRGSAQVGGLMEAALGVLTRMQEQGVEIRAGEAGWWQQRAHHAGETAAQKVDWTDAGRAAAAEAAGFFLQSAGFCSKCLLPEAERTRCKALILHATFALQQLPPDVQGAAESVAVAKDIATEGRSRRNPQEGDDAMQVDQSHDDFVQRTQVALQLLDVHCRAAAFAGAEQKGPLQRNNAQSAAELLHSLQGQASFADFDCLADWCAPAGPHPCPAVYLAALGCAVQTVWASAADSPAAAEGLVPPLAALLCRAAAEADGRDQQLRWLEAARDAAVKWPAAFPAKELQWLCAEAWNSGLYYHKLALADKAQQWLPLAVALAEALPQGSDVRSDVLYQYQTFLAPVRPDGAAPAA
eukprot:TRINITY_DN38799_c0_g1_i1.p1 TRINITY_DN38799_c0_g1~~TRINITY_DN38799_c0_g1_i1.p1  ORF type:complete len:923 (+),score=335.94 TRINITY_DN38799_c0_g1_i1:109-2877(+)